MTVFTNIGQGKQHVALAAPYAGKIIPLDLQTLGGDLICQRDSFLCAARGVSIGIAFQRKIGVGLFGGEGFIMERLQGDGLVFVHAGGTIHSFDLAPGQILRVDTGCKALAQLAAVEVARQARVLAVHGRDNRAEHGSHSAGQAERRDRTLVRDEGSCAA